MTRQEQEDQAQLEWLRKWKERRKEKRNVRKKPLFYKILRKLGIIKDYEEDIRTRMEMCERAIKANVCPEDCDICAWDTKGGIDYNGYITTSRNNRKPSEVSKKNQRTDKRRGSSQVISTHILTKRMTAILNKNNLFKIAYYINNKHFISIVDIFFHFHIYF